MELSKRIDNFAQLGAYLEAFLIIFKKNEPFQDEKHQALHSLVVSAHTYNGWFTTEQVIYAIEQISQSLITSKLNAWVANYQGLKRPVSQPKKVGIVMAGNIPLVGFHDFLCVLLSGHQAVIKTSAQDPYLLKHLADVLISFDNEWKNYITFTERLTDIEAVIATGSNNTSRYFDFYFAKYPHIIRKNRTSVAILTGQETQEELWALGDDIFRYFGLGCRNVSHIFIPQGYSIDSFYQAMERYADYIHHNKYQNNYHYHRALFLMNKVDFLDNNFLILREEAQLDAPTGVIHYTVYDDIPALVQLLDKEQEHIQCIVSSPRPELSTIPFGVAQQPSLSDYADGVDVLAFLESL